MYLALPKSIEALLAAVREPPGDDWADLCDHLVQTLTILADRKGLVMPVRRAFMMLGNSRATVTGGLDELQNALSGIDSILGEQFGGFARLLDSAVEECEVDISDELDFYGLPAELQEQLRPFAQAAEALSVLDDTAQAFDLSGEIAAACIAIDSLPIGFHGDFLGWLKQRGCRTQVADLFALKDLFSDINEKKANQLLNSPLLCQFCLWLVAHDTAHLVRRSRQELVHLNQLLSHAGLIGVSLFEEAQVFQFTQ